MRSDGVRTRCLDDVGLGHRRLSIIDLSVRGRQPMTNEDGSISLVFNGEVYDFDPCASNWSGPATPS
jgi:asparagine synthase (glutamine-hydrolysing)